MTKSDLGAHLRNGKTLSEVLPFTPGQDCDIYKAEEFSTDDTILYIPDIYLNEIPTESPVSNEQEISSILSYCYTGEDFIEECGGDVGLARTLFYYCDWQHPSSAYPEVVAYFT